MTPVTDLNYAAEKQRRYRERLREREQLRLITSDEAMQNLTRACINVGLATLDKTIRPTEYVRCRWSLSGETMRNTNDAAPVREVLLHARAALGSASN